MEEYRKPNKFCLDMVLVFILLGLCGVIYIIAKWLIKYDRVAIFDIRFCELRLEGGRLAESESASGYSVGWIL